MTNENYLSMKIEEKQKFWEQQTGNNELKVVGRIAEIRDTFCKIHGVRRISDNGYIDNPIRDGQNLTDLIGLGYMVEEISKKGLSEKDIIFFRLQLNNSEHESTKPVIMKRDSIEKVIDRSRFKKAHMENIEDEITIINGQIEYISQRVYDQYRGELENLDTVIKEKAEHRSIIEKQQDRIKGLTEQYKKRQSEIDDELEQIRAKGKKEIEEEFKEIRKSIGTELKNKKNKLQEIEDKLRFYDFIEEFDGKRKIPEVEHIKINNIDEKIKYIRNYLLAQQDKPLYYNLEILTQFYLALRTEQLVILAGSPGTGKTSLVEGFGRVVDAEFKLIPVQPNWMDKNDLLGFYNPVEKTYVPSPFLDAVMEARENRDKMYFICLDEMNLAHVEYYFAEFLSKLQTDKTIQLYSEATAREMKEEIKDRYKIFVDEIGEMDIKQFLQSAGRESKDSYFAFKKQLRMLKKYPPLIHMPDNIRFIGTLNKDETTRDLSPKVVDRSYIIMLELFSEEEMERAKNDIKGRAEEFNKPLDFKVEDFKIVKGVRDGDVKKNIGGLKKSINNSDINLNNRFDKTVDHMIGSGALTPDKLYDFAFAGLVLPKVSIDSYHPKFEELKSTLERIAGQLSFSKRVFEKMKVEDNEGNITMLTYWR